MCLYTSSMFISLMLFCTFRGILFVPLFFHLVFQRYMPFNKFATLGCGTALMFSLLSPSEDVMQTLQSRAGGP